MIEIALSGSSLPTHDVLAAAYLAAAAVLLGERLDATPEVRRINEDYGSRQEEHYAYGSAKVGLRAHAVGLMSGHGRHGTRTTWTGQGFALQGESQRHRLGKSFARLHATPEAEAAFAAALAPLDVRRASDDGAARAAVDDVLGRWQTGTGWATGPLIETLREAVSASAADSPGGATARFLLARLLLMGGLWEPAGELLEGLASQGETLTFCRGIACGLGADGSLWYVYRPSKTPPPWPHLEVRLALGWLAELSGDRGGAIAHYRAILESPATLRGGIRPDREAEKQLDRLF